MTRKRLELKVGDRHEQLVMQKPHACYKINKSLAKYLLHQVKCDCGAILFITTFQWKKQVSCFNCANERLSIYIWDPDKNKWVLTGNHSLRGTINNMKDRCTNKNNIHWRSYGGRGITYDPLFNDENGKFSHFKAIELIQTTIGFRPVGKYKNGFPLYTLERIDNNKGYFLWNLKWATLSEQNKNTRRTDGNHINTPIEKSEYEQFQRWKKLQKRKLVKANNSTNQLTLFGIQ